MKYIILEGKKITFVSKYVLPYKSYLKFKEEFPFVVNKMVSRECMPGSLHQKILDVTSYLKYDITTNMDSMSH